MTVIHSVFQLLEKGEFSEASYILGELLEKDPENEDFISGYYSIKYWQNREPLLNQIQTKNDFLLKEWNQFEEKLKQKNYKINSFVLTIKKFVIRKIANYIKNKFEKEGLDNNDVELLNQISIALISIGELEQAKEMLTYSKSIDPENFYTLFLFGDLLCLEAEILKQEQLYSKGLSLIRDSYILDIRDFLIENINSRILRNILKELNFLYEENEERIQYWFPVFVMEYSLHYDLRKLNAEEIIQIEEEIARLENELENVNIKFYEKTTARLIFFYLVIIHSLVYHYSNEERLKDLFERIKELSPKIYNDIEKILFQ